MASSTQGFDAVVIGAGFSGMHMLKSLRDALGLKVRVYEAGGSVGGTWYWNRYPGARCDSDSYIYCFTWDKDLLQEWEWSERYPEQPEILRYLEHVAKRHDLKRDIQFNTRVTGAEFDESNNLWRVRTDKGEEVTASYLIAAVGSLSDTNIPRFKGLERFKGKWYHTSRFPHVGVDFTAKRVAVVGTGATAVQAIPEIAQQAKQLTVFQRTANYCVPARNGKVDPDLTAARKADYGGVVQRIRESFFGFELNFIPKSVLDATPEEREREFDRMWDVGGFDFWIANYQAMLVDQEATLQIRSDKRHHLPYPLHGGKPGTPSLNILNPGSEQTMLPTLAVRSIRAGDVIRHVLAGGGGWGDPYARDIARVEDDVRSEEISVECALQEYGVVIDAQAGRVDEEETERVRAERKHARG